MEKVKLDPSKVPQSVRLRALERVLAKGVKPKDLGVSPQFIYMIRKGKRKVSDRLFEIISSYLDRDELVDLLRPEGLTVGKLVISKEGGLDYATVASILKAIEEEAEGDPFLRSLIVDVARRWMRRAKGLIHTYVVRPEDVERFRKLLADRAPKTKEDRVRYLLRALSDLGWELNPDNLKEYLAELKEESGYLAEHVSKSLKLFIRLVIGDEELYRSFKTVRPKERAPREPLTLDQVRAIAREIAHPGAKAYFALLAETGLRPGEVLGLRLSQLDLDRRVVKVFKEGATKHAYVAFFSAKLAGYLANTYLPFREEFVKRYASALRNLGYGEMEVRKWEGLLFPFKDYELRREIYRASLRAIGRRIRLYDLRAFFASYMSLKGLPGQVIDVLQGREPPSQFKVLARHYLAFSLEDLKRMYDRAGLSVL